MRTVGRFLLVLLELVAWTEAIMPTATLIAGGQYGWAAALLSPLVLAALLHETDE